MTRHRSGFALALAIITAIVSPARAAPPARAPVHHAQARLIGGAPSGDTLTAGLMIALDPGFKTYWRTPGDSGLPPAFDWSGSRNVAAVSVGFPAPSRIEDSAGVAYGYEDRVILPLTVRPLDPAAPVGLVLKLDYGVCREICIPEHADLTHELATSPPPEEAALVAAAFASVPRPQELGSTAVPSILKVERTGPDRLGVTVKVASPSGARLFVEAPDPWFLQAGADAAPLADDTPHAGLARFDVQVLQRPPEETGPVAITLTLAAGEAAIETRITLDASLLAR